MHISTPPKIIQVKNNRINSNKIFHLYITTFFFYYFMTKFQDIFFFWIFYYLFFYISNIILRSFENGWDFSSPQ